MNQENAEPDAVAPGCLPGPQVQVDVQQAADILDQLLSAVTELDRLARLIANAGEELMKRFSYIAQADDTVEAAQLRREAVAAMTALQFQDMAGQLVAHSSARITAAAEMMGRVVALDGSQAVQLPRRASPVAHHDLEAGSAELF